MAVSKNALIPYTKPSITKLEIAYAKDAVKNGWGKHCYDYINKFETAFAKHLGVKYAHATSSCTGALHLGLAALEIGRGDEVILADTNWIATCAPITYLKAKPVFVDIDPTTWCISPDSVVKAITKRTKAIIVTHLYGNLAWMDTLLCIGRKYKLPIIEDSAEALGSIYRNKRAGSMGTFGVFSFHGTKTMTTGEGGMFVTNDKKLYQKVVQLNNHGRDPKEKKQFFPTIIGYKYKISNVQAAIGLAQVERLGELIYRKRQIFYTYADVLPPVIMNYEQLDCQNSFWMPTIVSEKKNARDKYIKAFKKANIDARVFFYPLSSLPMFKKKNNFYSYNICTQAVNLPSYHDMTIGDQRKIMKVVWEVENNEK